MKYTFEVDQHWMYMTYLYSSCHLYCRCKLHGCIQSPYFVLRTFKLRCQRKEKNSALLTSTGGFQLYIVTYVLKRNFTISGNIDPCCIECCISQTSFLLPSTLSEDNSINPLYPNISMHFLLILYFMRFLRWQQEKKSRAFPLFP